MILCSDSRHSQYLNFEPRSRFVSLLPPNFSRKLRSGCLDGCPASMVLPVVVLDGASTLDFALLAERLGSSLLASAWLILHEF